jgi:DNA-binding CsgD family transcriptional regulator
MSERLGQLRVLQKGGRAGDFVFRDLHAAASLHEIQQDLVRVLRSMSASNGDQALLAVKAIARQLDDLPPPATISCRAASFMLRLAVLAFQEQNFAVLATVLAEVVFKGGVDLTAPLIEAHGRMEKLQPAVRCSCRGSGRPVVKGDAITVRQRDILFMISRGCSNKHIARMLRISPETVKSHLKQIFSKLSVSTRTEAVSRAVSEGLL